MAYEAVMLPRIRFWLLWTYVAVTSELKTQFVRMNLVVILVPIILRKV
jgi:hypothetical protein